MPGEAKNLSELLETTKQLEEKINREVETLSKRISDSETASDDKIEIVRDELELCRESLDELRKSVGGLHEAVMRHIQNYTEKVTRESFIDRERDTSLSELHAQLKVLLAEVGRSAGAEAGRKVANRWGPLWTSIGIALSMILSGAIQNCEAVLPPRKEKPVLQSDENGSE